MFNRFFTPQEAKKRLPLIKKIVGDILAKGKRLRALSQRPSQISSMEGDTLQIEIEILMKELEELGCFYKDWNFEVGLVDFPAKINEKEVFLCWRSDEPEIRFYHSLEDGYRGRMPIPEDLLGKN